MPAAQKTCLITGCSEGGVGDALVHAFKNNGYHVFATARNTSKIPASLHDDANVTIIALEVTQTSSILAAADVVGQITGGSLDVLINNAGAGMNMPALDTNVAEAKKLFDLNFFAALETVQIFSPMLVKARGCIVNNASIGGLRPLLFNGEYWNEPLLPSHDIEANGGNATGIYSATKASLIQIGEALRLEMAPLGVRVLTLITGGVATKFVKNFDLVVLPESSLYHSIKDVVEHQPDEIPLAVKPDVFAKEVLRHVDGRGSGKVWVGGGASMARWSYWLFPEWAIDRVISGMKPPFAKALSDGQKQDR